jgi:hypothetical protein
MFNKIKYFLKRIEDIWNLPSKNKDEYHNIMNILVLLEQRINENCEVHADIHYKEPHQIIVIGRYKGKDYVRVFGVSEPSFVNLVDRLRHEEKGSKVGRFDMMANWPEISVVYPNERF